MSLPQGHLLKPVTILLARVELQAHAESQRQQRKRHAANPPHKLDDSLKKCFVRKLFAGQASEKNISEVQFYLKSQETGIYSTVLLSLGRWYS